MKKISLVVILVLISVVIFGCLSVSAANMDFVDGSFLWQEDSYLLGIPAKSLSVFVESNFESDNVTIKNKEGNQFSESSYVGTGATVYSARELTVVVYGDVNGEGRVTTVDYILMKKAISDTDILQGAYKKAADVNQDGQIAAADYMMVKKSMGGTVDLYKGTSITPYQSEYKKEEYDTSNYRMDRSKINIGVYGWQKGTDSVFLQDSYFNDYKNNFGGDFIVAGTNSAKYYKFCEKYGIGFFAREKNLPRYTYGSAPERLDPTSFTDVESSLADYNDNYTYLWGDDVFDEPVADYFDWMAGVKTRYDAKFTDRFVFYNLNPVAPNGVTNGHGAADYRDYIRQYVNKIDTDFICFDIYPFNNQFNGMHPYYLENLDVVSTACRETGRDFWIITQTGSTAEEYKMTAAQLQWQSYTALAYGAKTIIYASYMPWWWVDNTCMVNKDGTKTDLWSAGKDCNEVIHTLSPVYMEYEHLGVSTIPGTTFLTKSQLRLQSRRNEARGYGGIRGFSDVESENGIIIGSFEKKDGNGYAMMLVESCDPYDMTVFSTVTFKVADSSCSKVTAYPDGKPQVLTAVDGVYSVELESGQGLFVTVE
ncbi:MAG: hypothetical protein E7388_05100 [Ruminococcaceae bacterium]|nr:hypothetical protein [Oscillospiraceae bacterium]